MSNPTNMEDFIKAVKEDLTDRLSDLYPGIHVEQTYVEKAQGESYGGIRLKIPGQVAAPVMNVEPFYEKVTTSVPYREVIEDMDYYAQKALTEVPEISTEQLTNYMEMKDRLTMQAIPIKGNEEMLAKTPHRQIADMAIIYRFVMNESERGAMSTVVTNDMMARYGLTADELHLDAAAAMRTERPYEIRPLFDVLGAMSPDFAEENQPDNMLYVATYGNNMYGAGSIGHPDFMEDAAVVMRGSFFILPSSIHEVLLLPDDGKVDYRELMAMVKNINETMVSPEERLTDNVYHYDSKEKLFEVAKDHADRVAEKEQGKGSLLKNLAEKKEQIANRPAPARGDHAIGGAVL